MLKCDKHFQRDICDSGDEEHLLSALLGMNFMCEVMASFA